MDDLNTRYGLEPLLGISELAAYLGVPAQRIYDWRLAGQGPRGYRIGRELKFPVSEVRRWLNEHAEPPPHRDEAGAERCCCKSLGLATIACPDCCIVLHRRAGHAGIVEIGPIDSTTLEQKAHPGCPQDRRSARMAPPRIVSLFSGAGGLDLGFHDQGYEIAFAVDRMAAAVKTHQRNFPRTTSVAADVTDRDTATGKLTVLGEIAKVLRDGEAIGVIGGPPCQGFSRANPKSHAGDPRNQMPSFYLEIVEALQQRYDVQFVLFENVMGIRDAKHSVTFRGILSKFEELNLISGVAEHSALDYGVPQTRNRVIISGFKSDVAAQLFEPKHVTGKDLTVRGAIGDLAAPAFFARDLLVDDIPVHPNHWTMRPISKRFKGEATEPGPTRSFRRLSWEKPSPTVAYGHREIHVHPDGTRRLSIYEAMLLQGFPSTFVLEGTLSQQVEQISNAVPPPVARSLAAAVTAALRGVQKEQVASAA